MVQTLKNSNFAFSFSAVMNIKDKLKLTAEILLDISALLMVSGANTNRINLSLTRFASALNCQAYSMVTHKTLVLTVTDIETEETFTRVRKIPKYRINFSTISAISKASWSAMRDDWTLAQINEEINLIKTSARYPNYVVLVAVSLAGAGFCNIFEGDTINMVVAFFSTLLGLFILQTAHGRKINGHIATFLASFSASFLASLGVFYNLGEHPQAALATSVLFLVPGVALINSFTDFLDNNILNGMVRFANGTMTVLSIALGLFVAMLLF